MAKTRAIFDLLEAGDLPSVQAFSGDRLNFRTLHPELKITPLQALVFPMVTGTAGTVRSQTERYVELAAWLMHRGADPAMEAPEDCGHVRRIWKTDRKEETLINIHFSSSSAISVVVTLRKRMQDMSREDESVDWNSAIGALSRMLGVLSKPVPEQMPIDPAVVDLWERACGDKPSHDLTFETTTGAVTGHASILSLASPVLAAMLSSQMQEGQEKRIKLPDSSSECVVFLLDLVYTGSSCIDFDPCNALAALDLAHRWQMQGVVKMLERALARELTDANFSAVAESAILKGLRELAAACEAFAQTSPVVERLLKAGTLPPALLDWLRGEQPTESSPKKRRRYY